MAASNTGSGTHLQRLVQKVKDHWAVVSIMALLSVMVAAYSGVDVYNRLADDVSSRLHPHAAEYEALATLDLDTTPQFVDKNFGVAKREFDLCSPGSCPETAPADVVMHIHETEDLTVRVIFAGARLEMYTVTINTDVLSPPIRWRNQDLGDLGKVTYADVGGEPTDVQVFLGPKSTAYAEVLSGGGGMTNYRGQILGFAPTGYGGEGMKFDIDAAQAITEAQDQDKTADPSAVANFRARSTPNTFGEFRDDGSSIGELMQDAHEVVPMLFAGTEL